MSVADATKFYQDYDRLTALDLGQTFVAKTRNPGLKGWCVVAMIVGAFVLVGAGGFGTMGLLHSHGLISLPQGLAAAIGTIGCTPHFWSLWFMAIGGVVLGGSLLGVGACNAHKVRVVERL